MATTQDIRTPSGVTLRVSAKTGFRGLDPRAIAAIQAMTDAAPAAGIAVIDITAGAEGGHISHLKGGTEVDLKGYNADGSLWTPAQRVAVAAGAQTAGADRLGLYSFGKGKLGSGSMHVGFSGPGKPAAVWGADGKVRGDASRRFTDPAEKAFLASYQAGQPFDIASLGLQPSAAPQDAQSAIASLIAPSGGPSVPDQPTAAMGYAPNIPAEASFAPPMPQVASAASQPPMPSPPPSWAQNGGFPIDEALSGASAQDVLMGGPRMDPRRVAPGSGPMPADMGAMLSPADVLNAGPNLRPGGAPDASAVPDPTISPFRPAMGGPADRRPQPPTPTMRPGGAPDAASVPLPPPRAQGIPNPPARGTPYAPDFPDLYGQQPGPPMPAPAQVGDMSAAMGNRPSFAPKSPQITDSFKQSFDLANDMNTTRENTDWWTGALTPQASPPPAPSEARTKDDAYTPAQGPFFGSADPSLSLPPSWSPDSSFPAPPPPTGTVAAGSTGGEFFSPAPPMPSSPPDPMASRFNDAFSPGGGGQIMDLQSAFNRQNAPPTMNAQGGINSVFGAPPVQAAPPNLAIPFAEVPGFDTGRFAGASPAEAATVASPLPQPAMPPSISRTDFDARFGGGSVVRPSTPVPGQPGVVSGEMPQPGPMDIRSQAQGGPPMPTPMATIPTPPPAPKQTTREQKSIIGRILGGLLAGPAGALGGGLLGGGGGGFGFGGQPTFAWSGGGSAPYGNGGSTTYQKGTSNALGGSNALTWQGSNGQPVTVVQDPWTGTYMSQF